MNIILQSKIKYDGFLVYVGYKEKFLSMKSVKEVAEKELEECINNDEMLEEGLLIDIITLDQSIAWFEFPKIICSIFNSNDLLTYTNNFGDYSKNLEVLVILACNIILETDLSYIAKVKSINDLCNQHFNNNDLFMITAEIQEMYYLDYDVKLIYKIIESDLIERKKEIMQL
jgi:hypothetical protein